MGERSMDFLKAAGMCRHGNFPSSCSACRSETKEVPKTIAPQDLLLTAEEEAAIEQPSGEIKRIHANNGAQELLVLGVEHVSTLERARPIADELASFDPDVVFVEGESLEKRFPGMSLEEILNMPAEQVLQQQEQAYTFWLATKQGRTVRSWDLPAGGEIQGALDLKDANNEQKHSLDAAAEWHVAYAMKKLYESGMTPTAEIIYDVIRQGVPGAMDILHLTPESIETIAQNVTGRSLEEASQRAENEELRSEDQKIVANFSEPRTNAFARDMNIVRDRHAIDVIQQAKAAGHKKILVTAGRSHAYTWEPAIKALYSI